MYQGPQDTRILTGVMDQDSALWAIAPQNYRYALNLINIYNQQRGSHTNIVSNVEVINSDLKTGINKCVGTFEDIKGGSVIFAVYNSLGYHGWFRYYQNKAGYPNGAVETIYQVRSPSSYTEYEPNPLDFDPDYLITGINLVDDLLFWTDKHSSPKMMNIARANLTGKKRVFNIYFNDQVFGVVPSGIVNGLSLYQAGVALPVAILSWTQPVTVTTYAQAVANMLASAGGSVFALSAQLEDKGNYVQATVISVGDYYLDWTNNHTTYSGVVIAENFYPDITSTTVSYSALKDDLIERVKYPPRCQPTGVFDSDTASKFQFVINPHFVDFNFGGIILQGVDFGTTSVISDPDNVVVQGGNVVLNNPPFSPGDASSYIINTSSDPKVVSIGFNCTITGYSNGLTADPINIFIGPAINPAFNNSVQIFSSVGIFSGVSTTYNFSLSGQYTIPAGAGACVWAFISLGGVYDISGVVTGQLDIAGLNVGIASQFPSFRSKYIYKDNQNSVYGAISHTIVSDSSANNYVELDFTDPRLATPELVSDIKNVELAVSLDNGVTWNNFASLDPYEYVGVGRQKYTYRGKEVLITVPESEAILLYHDVPLLSKSQEFIDDRIWDGEVVRGYDKVDLKMTLQVNFEPTSTGEFYAVANANPPFSASRWRRGWKGYIGVAYYDDADRKTPVCIDIENSYVEIPSYTGYVSPSTLFKGLNPAYLTAAISSAPPSWAKKYQFVRSQDLSQQAYLVWCADEIAYVNNDDSQVSATPTPQTKYIRISIDNIAYYNDDVNKGAKIGFTFVNGDRVRFIQSSLGVFFQDNDYVIAIVVNTFVYIVYDGSIQPSDGCMIEFYTPRSESENLLYFEFGECYDIEPVVQNGIDIVRHKGETQDQVFPPSPLTTVTPAMTDLKTGDVWYRARNLYYNTITTPISRLRLISSSTPSDFTDVDYDNNGRPNSADLLGRTYQDTGLNFSDQYISGTLLNGLAVVQPANYKQFSTVYGGMDKMIVVNNDILKLFFRNGYQLSIYVNQGVIRQTQGGQNIISVINEVANNSHLIERSLGTINAESVVLNDEGDVFGYDGTEGVCWMSPSNGLVDVSDTGMSITWRNYGLSRLALGGTSQTPSVFDLSNQQYIITLNAMLPHAEILPKATVMLPNITEDFFSTGGAQVTITIVPNNTVVYNAFTNATSWQAILVTAFSAFPAFQLNLLNNGSTEVVAPSVTGYDTSSLIITVTYGGSFTIPPTASTGTYTFPFEGGQPASEGDAFPAVTLSYNKERRGWINYYSFTPEMYGRLRNQVVSFVDGKLFTHANGVGYNNFYGVQYSSLIRYILNNDYPKVKVPLSLWYRGLGVWGAYMRNLASASYPWGQETEMTPAHFLLEEDGYYAPVMKNKLDPRYPSTDQAWVNGEDIRGDATEIELYNNESTAIRLDSSKTIYLYSENS
jgi:hypothetical protein